MKDSEIMLISTPTPKSRIFVFNQKKMLKVSFISSAQPNVFVGDERNKTQNKNKKWNERITPQ